jgi:hypothetical protein
MNIMDWLSLLHHYLNYDSLSMNQMTQSPVYRDSDERKENIGGRNLMNSYEEEEQPTNKGIWDIPYGYFPKGTGLSQQNGFSLDSMPNPGAGIYSTTPQTLQNWR